MRRLSQICSIIAIAAATNAAAHTSSVGYESAGPGSVTFWYGTYHGGTSFTEGSLSLVGQDVTFSSTVPFTTVTQTKPAGLIDGTTNFYSSGGALTGTPTTSIVAWQGATFVSLVAGTYVFTYIPIANPTATWAPIDSVILSSSVTLSPSIVNPGPTIIDTSQPSFTENDPAATGTTIEFDGGTFAPTTDITLTQPIISDAGGAFIDTTSGDVAASGDISGVGGLTKDGAGTLRLTGTSSYAGATTITAGTLIGDTDSLQGPITNNGTVTFDQAANGAYAGAISGGGAFAKEGAAILRLTGANNYTGGTTVTAGILIGDALSLQGPITNNAILQFDQATDGTYAGAISGNGSFIKDGVGTLRLTGINSYTGGTLVTAGTLIGDAASLQGSINNGATVAFDQASDATYTGPITGTGAIVKQGAGTLRLDGVSSYSGLTDVEAGRLSVNGSIANSQVQVEAGASIGGNGTIGGLIVRTNATAAPGNSIGTLTAATTILFEPNSFYSVEVDAAGNNDRVAANGTATLQGGTVQVLAEAGAYAPATRYTILTADGGVDGEFADVTSNLAFLTPSLSYTSNAVSLLLVRNDLSFASAGQTPNQIATGTAVDLSFAIGSPVYDALVETSAAEARSAFDALSGELHASLLSATAKDADFLRRTLLGRLDTPQNASRRSIALWASGFGNWGRLDGDGNARDVRRDSRGFLIGAETALNDSFMIGVAGGHSKGDVNVRSLASHADVSSTHGAAYAGYTAGPFTARIGGSYTHLSIDTRRALAFGSFAETLTARYKGSLIQAFGEAGYKIPLGRGTVEPFAGVNALWLRNKAFAETGGTAALKGASQSRSRSWSTVGIKAVIGDEASPLTVHGRMGWQHALSTQRVESRLAFAASGENFDVRGVPLARDAGLVDAGLTWRAMPNVSIGIDYVGTIANQSDDHSARATISVLF